MRGRRHEFAVRSTSSDDILFELPTLCTLWTHRPEPRAPRTAARAATAESSPATSRAARARSVRTPPTAADRWSVAWEGYSAWLKEHLEALSVPISIGIGGCRRDDEQTAAQGGGGGESVDDAASGAALGRRGARRSGVRAAMARRTAADAPPERARAARTAPPEPRSRRRLRAGDCARALLCVLFFYAQGLWGGPRAVVGQIDAARRPHASSFASGCAV